MSSTRYVTLPRYRQWLQAQGPDAVVGLRKRCYACPLRQWLLATHPAGCDSVDTRTWVDAWDVRHRIPLWARRHMRVIDALPDSVITAEQALACLEAGQTS